MILVHLYKEYEEEQVRREFTEDKRKNQPKCAIDILECVLYSKLILYKEFLSVLLNWFRPKVKPLIWRHRRIKNETSRENAV